MGKWCFSGPNRASKGNVEDGNSVGVEKGGHSSLRVKKE